MRGLTPRADSGNIAGRLIEAQSVKRRSTNATDKLLNQFTDAFDKISFDEAEFAFALSVANTRIQRRFLDIVLRYVNSLAERCEHALYRDEEDRMLCEDGKAIAQAMRFLDD